MFRSLPGACAALFVVLCTPPPVAAEVYLTKEQALKTIFDGKCQPEYDPRPIPSELRAKLRAVQLAGEDREQAHFFHCAQPDGHRAYALIDSEIGKHLPITYIVGLTDEGNVSRVEMMVFREIRGWEARERRFMRQFEGTKLGDDLSIGGALANVTGATLSSQAISRGVQRAFLLWREFYAATTK